MFHIRPEKRIVTTARRLFGKVYDTPCHDYFLFPERTKAKGEPKGSKLSCMHPNTVCAQHASETAPDMPQRTRPKMRKDPNRPRTKNKTHSTQTDYSELLEESFSEDELGASPAAPPSTPQLFHNHSWMSIKTVPSF